MKIPVFWKNSDCSRCLSILEEHFKQKGRPGDYQGLIRQITTYWRTNRDHPRRMVLRLANLLRDAPELFRSLNTLLLAGDGDTEVFPGTTGDKSSRLEIAMVVSRGKGYLCCASKDSFADKPAFMSSEELVSFLDSNFVFGSTLYMKTISKRWAPFVLELLQLVINDAGTSSRLRRECIMYMRYLSWSHRVLPSTFYLPGVVRSGDHPVSGGGFSDIWKGRIGTRKVCIKVLRFFVDSSNREDIMNDLISEVLLLRQLRHPNILPFLGVNDEVLPPSFAIITPWMPHGNLSIYLKHVPCSLKRKVNLLRQVVEGVRYLHSHTPPVIHCDIKAGNILVSEDETCCIGDFGLSILQKTSNEFGALADSDQADNHSGIRGSLRWLAPELLGPYAMHSARNKSTRDIYALGCTILEVISGHPPFYDEKNEMRIMIDVLNGQRPRLPPDTAVPGPLLDLIESCWEEEMDVRPDAGEVLNVLDGWRKFSAPTTRREATSPWDLLMEEEEEEEEEIDLEDLEFGLPPLPDEADEDQTSSNLVSPALTDSLFDARDIWDPNDRTNTKGSPRKENPTRPYPPPLPRLDVVFKPGPSTSTPLSTSSYSEPGSGLTSDSGTDSSEWWSDEDRLGTPDSSANSIPVIMSGYDFDTYRFLPESTCTEGIKHNVNSEATQLRGNARSEPAIVFKPPKGSVWHDRELQSAWNWYMGRRFLSGKG